MKTTRNGLSTADYVALGKHLASGKPFSAFKPTPTVYCVDCGAETELECICDELNFADGRCTCGEHNEI